MFTFYYIAGKEEEEGKKAGLDHERKYGAAFTHRLRVGVLISDQFTSGHSNIILFI
jgi:hypothetical protein